eukprot:CAMPEP_0114316830 /NCGR_PEP_ID=MMETSP0059-20121206/23486_1 /TAXON_ID=36894 /ORGANISM="Pyramimonas parkeae, Strain CCMP726" /LENGTH=94 /DNA_ID=CAMNT_0001442935 /DNA_START=390 /DNA_END=670 /DNA_ORIENTATION=+
MKFARAASNAGGADVPEELLEHLQHPAVGLLAELVPGVGLGYHLDDASLVPGGQHPVGEDVEVQPRRRPHVAQQRDHLQRQHVLPAVVAHLEDA